MGMGWIDLNKVIFGGGILGNLVARGNKQASNFPF
jgi:hypothetical protein